jgi:hypothetical protein
MDRLTALTLCAVGCAAVPHAASPPAIDELRVAAYDAPLSVVLGAVRDVAMTRFHKVTVSPREGVVSTNWQWAYGGPVGLSRPEHLLHAPCQSWGARGDGYLDVMLWRVDVSVTGNRPWRIKVRPHFGQYNYDDRHVPGFRDFPVEELYAENPSGETEAPAWLQQCADSVLAQVDEQLRPLAAAMPKPLRASASLDVGAPPLPPSEIVGPPGQIVVEFDTSKRHINRYRLNGLSREVAFIEGATIDESSRAAIGGVVVTASIPGQLDVRQTVSDETGYYRFDDLKPGVYSISASYSIDHRGQIEVRRSDIEVEGGEIAIVPIFMDVWRPRHQW